MIFLLLIFFLGLLFGSFLNVLIDRLPREESVLSGRSHCESCKHKLAWYDLVPLLSFLMLKGKCRYCHTSLSWYYPTIEVVTGVLFVITTNFVLQNFQFSLPANATHQALQAGIFNFQSNLNIQFSISDLLSLIFYLFLVSSLIVIFFIDLKFGIIPDKILFPAIAITFFYQLYAIRYTLYADLLSALGAFTFFLLLHLLTRGRGMGFGDVKFVILMGLVLGFPGIVFGLYIAFLTGAIISLILVAWGKKKLRGSTIPFGPFLVLGMLIALFWGDEILRLVSLYLL